MIIKQLGKKEYTQVYTNMQEFTKNRTNDTPDELWVVEFEAVYTIGISKRDDYPKQIAHIPVITTDRGGQITYHGIGQIVIYLLIDIKRLGLGVKQFVSTIETAIIAYLSTHNITTHTREGMPGVYVDNKKIASLGLKITNNGTYHGISLNTQMDLTPFSYIDTCGYKQLQVCQLSDFTGALNTQQYQTIAKNLAQTLHTHLTKP